MLPLAALLIAAAPAYAFAADSQCYGRPGKGRLDNGVKLPLAGANFSAYSRIAAAAGRTFLHSRAATIVVSSYDRLNLSMPGTRFMYGETGLASGGRFRPHRTHQNGLSIDFFVPVRDAAGASVNLPTAITARFGYDIEFDKHAAYKEFSIDFAALGEHLYELDAAARRNGARIDKVILDTDFLPRLFASRRGPWLKKNIPFMMGKPWVRHDEHYHVDIALPCKA